MPSPTSHIFYARQYIRRHGRTDVGAFLRGSIFPDIRYIANINRAVTHRRDVGLDEIADEPSDWRAGVLLHSWIDEAWTSYFSQYGLDPEDHSLDSMRAALKLVEDDQMHVLLRGMDLRDIAKDLTAGAEGEEYGIPKSGIASWNKLVADLVLAQDSKKARELLMNAMHIGAKQVLRLEERERQMLDENGGAWQGRVEDCRRLVMEIF